MVNNLTRVSEVTIAYRPKFKASQRPQVTTAAHTYQILLSQWDKDTIELLEEFKIMLLNRHNKVLGVATISIGGINGTVVDPKVVFAIALKAKASSIKLKLGLESHIEPFKSKKPQISLRFLKWYGPGSNRRHMDFQSIALPTELPYLLPVWDCKCSFFFLNKEYFLTFLFLITIKATILSINQLFTFAIIHINSKFLILCMHNNIF